MASIDQALMRLLPNVEWKITDEDYNQLEIYTDGVTKPTKKQIDDAITAIDIEKANEVANLQNAKNALLEKLGITADEAKLLLS